MHQSHYEFSPSVRTSGDQYLLFDIEKVDEDTGERKIHMTADQMTEFQLRVGKEMILAAQRDTAAAQPSVSRTMYPRYQGRNIRRFPR